MSGFKLLAIRPLEGCDPKFLKNLKEGIVYKFYQDYEYYIKDGEKELCLNHINYKSYKEKKIVRIKSPNQEVDFYSNGEMKINISAVVGKNGSGKSALTELFLKAMFDLSIENDFFSKIKLENQFQKEKQFIEKQIEQTEQSIRELEKGNLGGNNLLNIVIEQGVKLSNYNKVLKNHHDSIKKLDNMKGSCLFFELICQFEPNKPFIIRKQKGDEKITIEGIEKVNEKYLYKDLFYTILLNYSIYGLNVNEIGDWIDFLYHKNDGYQTPVVINPQKKAGNVDVNKEEALSRYRINRIAIEDGKIIDLNIDELLFSIKQKNYNYEFNYDWEEDTLFVNNTPDNPNFRFELNRKTSADFLEKISGTKIKTNNVELLDFIVKYFLGKLFKTDYLYNLNAFTFDSEKSLYKLKGLSTFCETQIYPSTSHKYLKLKQVLDIVKNKLELCQKIYRYSLDSKWTDFNVFKEELNTNENSDLKTSFTSIFNVDYKFEDGSIYSNFSSGQKQMINTLETINYHIRNVASNKDEYKSINIILDEVELYFHPEFQRIFIYKMINSIKGLNLGEKYSINILFLTHSPFILSDIPSNNILRLDEGEPLPEESQTFGANIHDLLANDFFLTNGFMGEFAKGYIMTLIEKVNKIKHSLSKDEFNHIKSQIDIINEKFIKHKLIETLESKYEDRFNDVDYLISKKEEEIDKLKKRKNDQDRK